MPFLGPKWPICHKIFFLCTNHYYYFIYLLALFTVQNLKKKYSKSRVMRMHQFCAPNGSLAPNKNLFLKKNINIIFIYLLAPFILQNFKKILKICRANPDLFMMCHFQAQNTPICPEQIFLVQTIIITFIYLLVLFIGQNLKKKFWQQIQSYEDAPLLGPKWSNCPKQFFFWKIIKITLIYLLGPFFVRNFKKILPVDPELRGCAIFGPKMTHFPKWEFFSENLLMSLVSFIHAYLHAKNQSQILIY